MSVVEVRVPDLGDFEQVDVTELALLTAERKDVEFIDEEGRKEIVISTYDDIDVEVSGTLFVDSPGASGSSSS